ncbi:MAG TPA: hypothetical protein VJP07_00100 [Dehalococcoidia bacterium]|nr:hypothetical protein [Dehalococcoidia bacterium]
MFRIAALLAIITTMILIASNASTAHAQYPPPDASLTVTASQTTATAGQQVTVSAVLRDADGDVLANQPCVARVASQPGTGASVSPTDITTDGNGVARTTLNVGTTPGTIQVEVVCGTIVGRVGVILGAAAQPPLSPIELPGTGSGPDTPSAGLSALLLLTAGAIALLAARRYARLGSGRRSRGAASGTAN